MSVPSVEFATVTLQAPLAHIQVFALHRIQHKESPLLLNPIPILRMHPPQGNLFESWGISEEQQCSSHQRLIARETLLLERERPQVCERPQRDCNGSQCVLRE